MNQSVPQTLTTKDHWHFGGRSIRLNWLAKSFWTYAEEFRSETRGHYADAARLLWAPEGGDTAWTGDAARSYRGRVDSLVVDADEVADQAAAIAEVLKRLGDALWSAESQLSSAWLELTEGPWRVSRADGQVTFVAQNDQQVATIKAATHEAQAIRRRLDEELTAGLRPLHVANTALEAVIGAWRDAPTGWDVPPELGTVSLLSWGGGYVLNTGGTNDRVELSRDKDGRMLIVVRRADLPPYVTTLPVDATLTVRTGAGNDVVTTGKDLPMTLTVIAGSGNDTVTTDDPAAPEAGYVSDETTILGMSGNDRLTGRYSTNVIRGGDGNDHIRGGGEWDLLDGGRGNDTILGLQGDDWLTGGEGADAIDAGSDWDLDWVAGESGADTITGTRYTTTDPEDTNDLDDAVVPDALDTVEGKRGETNMYRR